MKKLALILTVILSAAMLLPMAVTADSYGITENDPVSMPYASPVIDAVIDENEGWSTPALFDNPTVGYFWAHLTLTTSADIYFAYDDNGIYVAGDIVERDFVHALDQNGDPTDYTGNSFIPSTGEDDINPEGGANTYGWNGDVFIFAIDPLGQFAEAGFNGNADYTAWYCIGLFEDGTSRMYRSKVNSGDITSEVKLAAKTTDEGWIIETFIPWEIIVKDAVDMGFGDVNVTEEDMIANAATSRATVIYQDRFFDDEAGIVDTWGRYIIVPKYTVAGIEGQMSSGDCVSAYGLTLVNAGKGEDSESTTDTTAPDTDDTSSVDTSDTTVASSDTETTAIQNDNTKDSADVTTKNPTSTTKAPTTNKNTATANKNNGNSSAQTFDAGIAVAIGALAVSAIGMVGTKKSKKK